ncbi:ML3 [Symbiodinium sp. CCMP2456]|nr:ML3 [Symbiodinium sp. CCMP2456]
MGMSFDQQGDQSQQLDEGATAIMLRRLPSKLTIESLLDILSQFWPSRYNFVYVPHDKSRARNVALAFINFTDSETARMAYDYFQGRSNPMDVRLGSHIRVSQADVQGLSLNLAYFVARSGFADMDNPHAPRVFENGWRVNLSETVQKHVTMELMAQASQHMKAVEDARAARARRDPPKHDSNQHDTRRRGDVPPHVNVREVPGMPCWHTAGRDDSRSLGLLGACEGGGADPGASSSSSFSTSGQRQCGEGLDELFHAGLAEQQPDGSVYFFL